MKGFRYFLLFLVLIVFSACDIVETATGFTLTPPPEGYNDSIDGIAEGEEYPLQLVSVTVNSNYDVSITNGIVITNITWTSYTKTYRAAANFGEFMVYNADPWKIWPGALIQGRTAANGLPDPIELSNRKPMRIGLNLFSGVSNQIKTQIEHPNTDTVNQAVRDIVAGYGTGQTGMMSFEFHDIYSAQQMRFSLGVAISIHIFDISTALSWDRFNSSQKVMVRVFLQNFTASVDDFDGLIGVLGSNADATNLMPWMSAGNPPCYISSVTYGRMYLIKYESTNSSYDLKTRVRLAWDFGLFSGSWTHRSEFDSAMQDVDVTAVVMGEDPNSGIASTDPSVFKNFDTITNLLLTRTQFSSNSFGTPLSFTVKTLRDSKLVRMNNTMDYEQTVFVAHTNIMTNILYSAYTFTPVLTCMYQELTQSSYVGQMEFYVLGDSTPFYTWTLSSGQIWTNGTTLTNEDVHTPALINASGSGVRIRIRVRHNTGDALDLWYVGAQDTSYRNYQGKWSWWGPNDFDLSFRDRLGGVNTLHVSVPLK